MSTEQLILDIPEPVNGKCDMECPCCYIDSDRGPGCSARLNSHSAMYYACNLVPGTGCPQFQGG